MKTQKRYLVEFSEKHEYYYNEIEKDRAFKIAEELSRNHPDVRISEITEELLDDMLLNRIKQEYLQWKIDAQHTQ